MRKESYIARKRTYLKPQARVHAVRSSAGLLQSFSLNSAKNASENGNPPMDSKGGSGEWESIWD